MTITVHGQRFDLRFEQNIPLIPQLVQRLAAEATQDSAPAGDRSSQAANAAPLAIAFSLSA